MIGWGYKEQNASSTFCKNPKNKISINNKEQHFMLSSSIRSEFYFYKICLYVLRNINDCFKSEPALVWVFQQ